MLSLFTNPVTEDIMVKKTTNKKPAATAKQKARKAKAKKKAPAKKAERIEIELDPIQIKALELVHSSVKVRTELEEGATSAMSQAVRKVFKQHRIPLTAPQSQEIAAVLFGE
jgi:hypothetical protein